MWVFVYIFRLDVVILPCAVTNTSTNTHRNLRCVVSNIGCYAMHGGEANDHHFSVFDFDFRYPTLPRETHA